MTNAKRKGAQGENEFCEWLYKNLSLERSPRRNLDQVRSGGADILELPPYCFEVKRREKLDLYDSWCQVKEAAERDGLIPIVAFRKNYQKWQFLIPSYFLLYEISFGYVRLTEKVFKVWINDHYRGWRERT